MVAKMMLLAVSASAAVASASAARSLSQSSFASAFQLSESAPEENDSEGTTEADTFGNPNNAAYADAEGFAGYVESYSNPRFPPLPPLTGDFAAAITQADSVAINYDGVPGADAESFATSQAVSDFAAAAEATSIAAGVGAPYAPQIGNSALAVAQAEAAGTAFGAAGTIAVADGRRDASAFADSIAVSEEFAGAEAEADATALNNDAEADAVALADTIGGGFAGADARADSLALRGGAADSRAFSGAFNDQDAQAVSTAISESDSFAGEGVLPACNAGVATSRATSVSGGALPLNGVRDLDAIIIGAQGLP